MNSSDIRLRLPEPEDLDFIYNLDEDPRFWECGTGCGAVSRRELREYLAGYTDNLVESKQLRLIVIAADARRVGMVDIFDYDPLNGRASVGIVIAPEYQKLGIGHKALAALDDYCRRRLVMASLTAITAFTNRASIRLFEGADYTRVGILKRWLRRNGTHEDAILFQKLLY